MLKIAVGSSRFCTNWLNKELTWGQLVERLKTPVRGSETLEQYLRLPKSEQDRLKDVGGFVGGWLKDGTRKKGSVEGRSLVTLDLDALGVGGVEETVAALEALEVCYAVYSTRKHSQHKPRLRVLLPTDRAMTVDEYEPVARKLCSEINMKAADPTTFECHRLMYWPSCCADTDYVLRYRDDLPMVRVSDVLGLYRDWHDAREWPSADGEAKHLARAAKQADPETKRGLVGAFCRVYSVDRAIAELLPDTYAECGDGRYTYTGGSTAGGAVVYGNGRFLFSHHATDPAGGQLVNAFDLVRLHKFGDEDGSFEAMCGYINSCLPEVSEQVLKERMEAATRDFSALLPKDATDYTSLGLTACRAALGEQALAEQTVRLAGMLTRDPKSGQVLQTIENACVVLEHDHLVSEGFARNRFSDLWCVRAGALLPWGNGTREPADREWAQTDDSGLYTYFERVYGLTKTTMIDHAKVQHMGWHSFDPVREYLEGLEWDGVERLDDLLIDYLGAEVVEGYTREVTRKSFVAAVKRVFEPGCKHDTMLVLLGRQGRGKSTLLRKMGGRWFDDNIQSFDGKEAAAGLRGKWIIEIAEMQAMNRSDVNRVKGFLSQTVDRYRPSYERYARDFSRVCVLFGTGNDRSFIKDETGGRRFWPVDLVDGSCRKHPVDMTQDEVDQLWAEAVVRYRQGEQTWLTREQEAIAAQVQESHYDAPVGTGEVIAYCEMDVPEDWDELDEQKKRMMMDGSLTPTEKLVRRDFVCAREILSVVYRKDLRDIRNSEAIEVNKILRHELPKMGWVEANERTLSYGRQRGFKRPEEA